ncbi:hypothetical protein [Streptomyces phaeochromogenes]
MPEVTDPNSVPLTPVYTIVISEDDEARIDGQPVARLPHHKDARDAAIAELAVRAARRDRPVRAIAKEPDGSVWPIIVDFDAEVTPLDAPHPVPTTVERQPAHMPAATREAAVLPPPVGEPLIPAPVVPTVDWMAALPADFEEMFARVQTAGVEGGAVAAAVAAEDLEDALDDAFGPMHPYTVNVLGLRASLVLHTADWRTSMELHLRAAERRHLMQAPRAETLRLAHNAHFCWKHLVKPSVKYPGTHDPAAAAQWTGEVLRVLRTVGVEPIIIATTEHWAATMLPAAC